MGEGSNVGAVVGLGALVAVAAGKLVGETGCSTDDFWQAIRAKKVVAAIEPNMRLRMPIIRC